MRQGRSPFARETQGRLVFEPSFTFVDEPIVSVFVPATEDTPKGELLEEVVFDELIAVKSGETVTVEVAGTPETTKLRVHLPEPEKKVHAVFDDIEFDDDLVAKMMANMASNGMSLSDLGG